MRSILLSNLNLKDINPMECGEEYCANNFQAGPTSRQYFLLHFIFSGTGTFFTKDKEYTVSKGQIFIMHPFEVVHYRAEPSDPWHYCWVGFEMSIDAPVLKSSSVIDIQQAEHIFSSIRNADQVGTHKEFYICGKIYELLSMFEQVEILKKSKADEYIRKAKQYIDINYMHQITVEQIANDLNIDRSYFSTIFKKYMGKSPQQYLIDVRLENAAELISNYDCSISDAAVGSGYFDIFNFSKMFKQKFGVSPAVYAKKRKP
jgi:AraC-like DNA-binding protein